MVAVTLAGLSDIAVYAPDPPESVTFCAAQLVKVTLLGVALKVGHAPWADPERFTVTFWVVVPSETPTVNGAAPAAGDGVRRVIVTVFPEIEAVRASLPELTK